MTPDMLASRTADQETLVEADEVLARGGKRALRRFLIKKGYTFLGPNPLDRPIYVCGICLFKTRSSSGFASHKKHKHPRLGD